MRKMMMNSEIRSQIHLETSKEDKMIAAFKCFMRLIECDYWIPRKNTQKITQKKRLKSRAVFVKSCPN
jgi:hypothetical protein